MALGRAEADPRKALRSPIHWAVLGLIVEQPSHGYELASRFEQVFGAELRLSSPSYIYRTIEVLLERGLIEKIAGTARGSQPRPQYRATSAGISGYQEQLISAATADPRRGRVLARELAVLARQPRIAIAVIEDARERCFKEAQRSQAPMPESDRDPAARLAARLSAEAARVQIEAQLAWLDFAAQEFGDLLGDSGSATPAPMA